MSDIKLRWDEATGAIVAGFDEDINDVETDPGLATAVIVSLFTDARSRDDDELPDPNGTRRGWWGDFSSDRKNDSVGSRLWLFERDKVTNKTLLGIKKAAKDALQWMIDERIASSIEIEVEKQYRSDAVSWMAALAVKITKPTGTTASILFSNLWEGTDGIN